MEFSVDNAPKLDVAALDQSATVDVVAPENGSPVDVTALLHGHGVQVTAQRLAVLRAVSERPHSTAAEIDAVVRGRDRRHLASGGVRRPRHADREGPPPAHPARRVAGALRGPGGRQPPPPDLPHLRPDGRRRLRRRRHPVPDGRRRRGLRDRRGRGHLLGPLSRVRRDAAPAGTRSSERNQSSE